MQEKFAFLVAKRYAYKNFFVIFIGMSSFFLILRDALLNMLYEEWFHELTTYILHMQRCTYVVSQTPTPT